jgi:hypothetical protein
MHYGQADEILTAREQTLKRAWQDKPDRFVGGVPKPAGIPEAVWINAPRNDLNRNELKNEAPVANCPGASEETSLTHPRSSYPSGGCVPAELASVSSDESTIPSCKPLNTRAMECRDKPVWNRE